MSIGHTTREEAREGIRAALLTWRAEGVERPLLPVYGDADGDGIPDFYGLDENDDVVLVPGATLAESVAVSDGTGVEQVGEG